MLRKGVNLKEMISRPHGPQVIRLQNSSLNQSGVRVPDDVSLISFDNVEELKFFRPLLTTVRVANEKGREELAKLFFELIEHRALPPVKRMVPTELLVRESSARPGKGLVANK